jgi:parallel beta-helix repeat protein
MRIGYSGPGLGFLDNRFNRIMFAVVAASGGNYTSLEDALNAGEKSIFIRAGTYTPTIDLVNFSFQDGITIIGENPETVILSGQYAVLQIGDAKGCWIEGIQLENGTTGSDGMIDIAGGDYNKIINCVFNHDSGSDKWGMTINNSGVDAGTNNIVDLCRFDGANNMGLGGTGASSINLANYVSRCVFTGAKCRIDLRNISQSKITGNNFLGNGTAGVDVITVEGTNVEISGNTAYNATTYRDGLRLIAGSSTQRNLITGNHFRLCDGVGIYLQAGDNVVSNNKIQDCDGDGILIDGDYDRNLLNGNWCFNNGRVSGYGINIPSADANKTTVIGNTCYSNGTGQINDQGTNTALGFNTES